MHFLITLFIWGSSSAFAISMRHDVADSQYLVDPAEFPALVGLHPEQNEADQWGHCMSTLIGPAELLTVAHCADDFVHNENGKESPFRLTAFRTKFSRCFCIPTGRKRKTKTISP
jgi:hypothetical protein